MKPDLRISDAINNDVEVVTGRDDVLIYDRRSAPKGLSWKDLQAWWETSSGVAGDEAKRSLYKRLLAAFLITRPRSGYCSSLYFKHFTYAIPQLACAPARSMVALGPEDGTGTRQGCAAEVSHGLPHAASERSSSRSGG